MAIQCQRWRKQVRCEERATMYVVAFGGKAWDGYFCAKHASSIIKLRTRLIKKYKQSVVVRAITPYDKKRIKARRKR